MPSNDADSEGSCYSPDEVRGADYYEAIERAHFGDAEKKTGIYAPRPSEKERPQAVFIRTEDLCDGRVIATTYPFPGGTRYVAEAPVSATQRRFTHDIHAVHQFLGPDSGLTHRDVAAVLDAAEKVQP